MGIHSQTKLNLYWKGTCTLFTNLSTVKKCQHLSSWREPRQDSLFSDVFDSKWNSPTLEKIFSMTFLWPVATMCLSEVEKESGMLETKCKVYGKDSSTRNWKCLVERETNWYDALITRAISSVHGTFCSSWKQGFLK